MNRSDTKKRLLTALLSVILLIASSAIGFVFYYLTRYLPFYLMALTVLLPTVIYAMVLLVGLLRPCSASGTDGSSEGEEEIPAPEDITPRQKRLAALRRLPKRGFNNIFAKPLEAINVSALEKFEDGSTVTVNELLEAGVLSKCEYGVKILGNGTITKKLTVEATAFSASAKEKIVAAGGKWVVV